MGFFNHDDPRDADQGGKDPHAMRMTGQGAHSIAIVGIQWSAFLRTHYE